MASTEDESDFSNKVQKRNGKKLLYLLIFAHEKVTIEIQVIFLNG